MTRIIKIKLALLLLVSSISLKAQIPYSFDVENRGEDCNVSAGSLANNPNLPDPFSFNDGRRVATYDDWSCRRNEIIADFEAYELGVKPPRPQNISASYSGGRLTVTVNENGRSLTITSSFSIPTGAGPHPIVIGMDGATGSLSSSLFSGVVQVPFTSSQLATGTHTGTKNLNDPFYSFYPNLRNAGKYLAWSWGISRLIDGLELIAAQYNLDMSRVAVSGCSYAGKMALFAGALDERIALTIAQESGGGGINSWRTSQDFVDRTGTDVEKINNTNGSWFLSGLTNRNPYTLPHDHHELIAMIAPRAFLTLGNATYGDWLGDESGYKSTMAALEVWKAMGIEDRFGFDFSGGHQHCQAASSQNTAVSAFVDKFLRNNSSANTNVRIEPSRTDFDYNWRGSVDWTTPEIGFDPNVPTVTITSPTESSILVSQELEIVATVTDQNNDVVNVEFFIDDLKIGEDNTAPYSIEWMSQTIGEYTISVIATDAQNNSNSSSKVVRVRVPQGPFGGTPHTIPGIIQLEEYDEGGNGYAYSDDTPGSETGVNYRTLEDVDIEESTDASGGYNLGWTTAGEWTEYTVDVTTSGIYDIDIRVACNGDDRTISLSTDGNNIATDIALPNTGGWQEWETVTVSNITLLAGVQVLRLTIGETDYINLNNVEFELVEEFVQAPFGGTAHIIPGKIEAEDYDLGGEGLAYHEENNEGNQGDGEYRDDEVDIEICLDDEGGFNLGWTLAKEWVEYTVDVQADGLYDLDLRIACNGAGRTLSFEVDGEELASNVAIPNTGGWQEWETITVPNLSLSEGEQILRLTIGDVDYVNINYLEFRGVVTSSNDGTLQDFRVYPNPFGEDGFKLEYDGEFHYEITNTNGIVLEEGNDEDAAQLIGGGLPAGMYFLSLESGDNIAQIKLVKH